VLLDAQYATSRTAAKNRKRDTQHGSMKMDMNSLALGRKKGDEG
jgi:hypothetical protein